MVITCDSYKYIMCGLGSVVSIATGYRLDGPGIESQWGGRDFCACRDQPWGPPILYSDWL